MTKKYKEDMLAVLECVNPFAFRSPIGLRTYGSKMLAYLDCMITLLEEFPRGFVDVPLFMCKHQRIELCEATSLVGRKQYVLLAWDVDSKELPMLLKSILRHLLKVSEAPFDADCFNRALSCFFNKTLN